MSNRKFKVGDRVRIINTSMIEDYELNKIGTLVKVPINDYNSTYVVDMGRPRRPSVNGDNETCWWLQASMIELANKPNTQLLFEFMY